MPITTTKSFDKAESFNLQPKLPAGVITAPKVAPAGKKVDSTGKARQVL